MLKRQIAANRVSNAYLIEGYGDVETEAFEMAALLLEADALKRTRMSSGNELNFIHIKEPLKKEHVSLIQSQFQKSSQEGGRRVYLIESIDEASMSAMNSLLKFLEEPEGEVVALLTTTKPQRVLDTIRSRCVSIPVVHSDLELFEQAASDAGFDPLYGRYASYFTQRMHDIASTCEFMVPVFETFSEFQTLYQEKSPVEAGIYLQVTISKKKRAFTQEMFTSLVKIIAQEMPQLGLACAHVLDLSGPGMNVSFLTDLFILELRNEL